MSKDADEVETADRRCVRGGGDERERPRRRPPGGCGGGFSRAACERSPWSRFLGATVGGTSWREEEER